MKNRLVLLLALLLASVSSVVSVAHAQSPYPPGMGQPGYYGRIEIGGNPAPALLFPYAVMGEPGIYTGAPIYMHVPPAHAYAWSRYCGLYGACDWMVYFVDDDWYHQVYVPRFRSGFYVYAPPPVYAVPVVPVAPPRIHYHGRPHYEIHNHYRHREERRRDEHHFSSERHHYDAGRHERHERSHGGGDRHH